MPVAMKLYAIDFILDSDATGGGVSHHPNVFPYEHLGLEHGAAFTRGMLDKHPARINNCRMLNEIDCTK